MSSNPSGGGLRLRADRMGGIASALAALGRPNFEAKGKEWICNNDLPELTSPMVDDTPHVIVQNTALVALAPEPYPVSLFIQLLIHPSC